MLRIRDPKNVYVRGGVLAAVGLALAGASMPASAAEAPSLGAARTFAVLGGTEVTSTGATSITGDLGVSPGTSITGFPPGIVTDGTINAGNQAANSAHFDATMAYDTLLNTTAPPENNLSDLDLGGRTLTPGVYKFNVAAALTGDLVLNAGGDSEAVFIIRIGTSLTTSSGSSVTVINGGTEYDESNVFWQVGEDATLGSTTSFTGNILAYGSITLGTGATVAGNVLALHGAVTLGGNTVVSPSRTPVPPLPFIAAPLALSISLSGEPSNQSANLSWTDGSDNETEFRVYRRSGTTSGYILLQTVISANVVGTGSEVTRQDPLLAVSTTYTYRVTAFNAIDGESLPSNTVQVQTAPVVSTGRPSGARTILLPPSGGVDADAFGRLFVKHFPVRGSRAERTWFKLKLRRLDAFTTYTLWADDPATESTAMVQFDAFMTNRNGKFNYKSDTKKGAVPPFGATLVSLGGNKVQVRNADGSMVILTGTIPATNP